MKDVVARIGARLVAFGISGDRMRRGTNVVGISWHQSELLQPSRQCVPPILVSQCPPTHTVIRRERNGALSYSKYSAYSMIKM